MGDCFCKQTACIPSFLSQEEAKCKQKPASFLAFLLVLVVPADLLLICVVQTLPLTFLIKLEPPLYESMCRLIFVHNYNMYTYTHTHTHVFIWLCASHQDSLQQQEDKLPSPEFSGCMNKNYPRTLVQRQIGYITILWDYPLSWKYICLLMGTCMHTCTHICVCWLPFFSDSYQFTQEVAVESLRGRGNLPTIFLTPASYTYLHGTCASFNQSFVFLEAGSALL